MSDPIALVWKAVVGSREEPYSVTIQKPAEPWQFETSGPQVHFERLADARAFARAINRACARRVEAERGACARAAWGPITIRPGLPRGVITAVRNGVAEAIRARGEIR